MITRDLKLAVSALKNGQAVAFPTETVYGLGANALDPVAVASVYEIKQRPLDHPLIVHVDSLESAKKLTEVFPPLAETLAAAFWPGPLTIVLPKSGHVPDITSGGLSSVGIRVPRHPLALELLKATGFPIAAPSANPFGSVSPTTAAHVAASLPEEVLILEGGSSEVGLESTIVSFLSKTPEVLRLGGIPVEDLEKVIGPVKVAGPQAPAIAPGMLASHYATTTPLRVLNQGDLLPKDLNGLAALSFQPLEGFSFPHALALSPKGNLAEAAAKLYSALRELDALGAKEIYAFRFPEKGLGRAINDRLERAAHR